MIKILKKKTAHAYYERPYFSKSFGGKILEIGTAFTMDKILYMQNVEQVQ